MQRHGVILIVFCSVSMSYDVGLCVLVYYFFNANLSCTIDVFLAAENISATAVSHSEIQLTWSPPPFLFPLPESDSNVNETYYVTNRTTGQNETW